MNSRAPSRSDAYDVALIGLSARALARSASRAGLRALALDLFADADTSEHAATAVRVAAARRGLGLDARALAAALAAYAPEGLPVVLGPGFEHAPRLMARIAERNPLIGAAPETVRLLKDPARFAALLAGLGVPHPEIVAAAGDQVLSKRRGGSGGAHIRAAEGLPRRGRYFQRRVDGRSVSALFLCDGRKAQVIGFSEQWTDPTPAAPFRYGGAVGPIAPNAVVAGKVAAALSRIVAATGLLGLASADLLLPDDQLTFWLLEINPRPGATLDVFDRAPAPALLGLHLDACRGLPPEPPPRFTRAQAAGVLYAEAPTSVASLRRPVWTADWPACEEIVPAGAPVCTVLAAGASPSAARALFFERRAALLASLRAASRPARGQLTMVFG